MSSIDGFWTDDITLVEPTDEDTPCGQCESEDCNGCEYAQTVTDQPPLQEDQLWDDPETDVEF